MIYNIISIDPSLISTAMVVSSGDTFKMYNYCIENKVMGKKDLTKWYKMSEPHVTYRFIDYRKYTDYSEGELVKLKDYDKISDIIISDIKSNINNDLPTKIAIEGYSFNSTGDIIGLVTFSTILRKKLFDLISEDITVLSPSTLKLESCKLTYKPLIVEKGTKKITTKEVYRNNIGVAGGSFTKIDIFLSIIENGWDDYWSNHCRNIHEEILSIKTIPKPYEDLADSYILYQVLKKKIMS